MNLTRRPLFFFVFLIVATPLLYSHSSALDKKTHSDYQTDVRIKNSYQAHVLKELDIPTAKVADEIVTIQVTEEQLEILARRNFLPFNSKLIESPDLETKAVLSQNSSGQDLDNDGLTDTEEAWWNTNPNIDDTDGDGFKDGEEVEFIKLILSGEAFLPDYEHVFPPFSSLPTEMDQDSDYLPDNAERFVIGTSPNAKSTDGDKYSDGQELFGRSPQDGDMPASVMYPGSNVFVAAYPDIKIEVNDDLTLEILEEITTAHTTIETQTTGIETTVTTGSSTTTGTIDTHTYSTWQEAHNSQADGEIYPGSPGENQNRNTQDGYYQEGRTLGNSMYVYPTERAEAASGTDDQNSDPQFSGINRSLQTSGQKDVSTQSNIYQNIIYVDNDALQDLLGIESAKSSRTTSLLTMSSGWYWPTNSSDFCDYLEWLGYNNATYPWHLAQDMCLQQGDPVYSIWDGDVVESRTDVGGYGPGFSKGGALVARYQANDGTWFSALYGHLDRPHEKGHVSKGEIIGYANSFSPPHLHFGIHAGFDLATNPWRGYTDSKEQLYGFVDPIDFLNTHPITQPSSPPNQQGYDNTGRVDFGIYLASLSDPGSMMDDILSIVGYVPDIGGVIADLTSEYLDQAKSELGLLITTRGRDIILQAYNSWLAQQGNETFEVDLYVINEDGKHIREMQNPLYWPSYFLPSDNIDLAYELSTYLFPSQKDFGLPDFVVNIPNDSQSQYEDFLEYYASQINKFGNVIQESVGIVPYTTLDEVDSQEDESIFGSILEFLNPFKERESAKDSDYFSTEYAYRSTDDFSRTSTAGTTNVNGVGEETSYSTVIENTTWEERSQTEVNLLTTGDEWTTATTVHPEHAANLDFSIKIQNVGTDTAVEIEGLKFNVQIGDNPQTSEHENFPPITYPPFGQSGETLENFFPGKEGTFGISVPLTLEQMRAIDQGADVKIYVANYSYGDDELVFNNAWHSCVMLEMDDGVDDNDETIERFLTAVIGDETYTDAFNRAKVVDSADRLVDVGMNEVGSIESIIGKNIGDYSWWNVYLTEPSNTAFFAKAKAQTGNRVLLKFNQDSDEDGYKDRDEFRIGTDRNDSQSHPAPELIAVQKYERTDDDVVVSIKIQNIGNYDATGIEARLFSLDDSVSITNAVIGGDGIVKAGTFFMPTNDYFLFAINREPYTPPVMFVSYKDPQGGHAFISRIVLENIDGDISGRSDDMMRNTGLTVECAQNFLHSADIPIFLRFNNPLDMDITGARVKYLIQSVFGSPMLENQRQVDIHPGENTIIVSFTPSDHFSDKGIGKKLLVTAAIEDYQGVQIDASLKPALVGSSSQTKYSPVSQTPDLSDTAIDLGESISGELLTVEFTVFNTGLSEMELFAGTESRNASVSPTSRQIAPGDSTTIQIEVDTASKSGAWEETILIGTGDPSNPVIPVTISGTSTVSTNDVTFFDFQELPWTKWMYIKGTHAAEDILTSDHPIANDTSTEPLEVTLRDGTVVGKGKAIAPTNFIIDKMEDGRIQFTVPETISDGIRYLVEFGKSADVENQGIPWNMEIELPVSDYPKAELTVSNLPTWHAQKKITDKELFGVVFGNRKDGWAVGEGGTIICTHDGGATWNSQVSGHTAALYSVDEAIPNKLYAVGEAGLILSTTDGGATWSTQTSPVGVDLKAVQFINVSTGWIAGDDGNILKTNDSGVSWEAKSGNTSEDLNGLFFIDEYYGWIAGSSGTVLLTSDGGETWSVQTEAEGANLNGVHFISRSNGWIVGDSGIVLKSTDGGSTWVKLDAGTMMLNDVLFVNSNECCAVGNNGTILHSIDGGENWFRPDGVNLVGSLNRIAYGGNVHLWIVGAGGHVINHSGILQSR